MCFALKDTGYRTTGTVHFWPRCSCSVLILMLEVLGSSNKAICGVFLNLADIFPNFITAQSPANFDYKGVQSYLQSEAQYGPRLNNCFRTFDSMMGIFLFNLLLMHKMCVCDMFSYELILLIMIFNLFNKTILM